jgi:formyltetrahydrofolate deformylase
MNARVLLVECADRPGLVHGIAGALLARGANVVGNQEFVDRAAGRFFMRTEFEVPMASALEGLEGEVRAVLPAGALVRLAASGPRRLVVMASKEHHCLSDLLVRLHFGELRAEVAAVVSNHAALGGFVERFGIPFHYVPAEGLERSAHEVRLLEVIEPLRPEVIVLAKYMRVLTPEFVARFPHRIVNIHHSFLPAFVGARPYHQAFERGVKVIGATAHFVTDALDAGPIIVQQTLPVDHTRSAEDLARAGRDVEQFALAQALRLVLEDRVFLSGNRTVIFD